MSKGAGLLSQIWKNMRHTVRVGLQKEVLVGYDQRGNKYYERIADPKKGIKPQRRVQSTEKDEFHVPEVPTEWMTWLQGRRKDPPTEEEIEKNFIKMIQRKHKAKEVDARNVVQEEPDTKILQNESVFPKYEEYEISPGEFRNKADRENKT